jgi:hypothetical protein
MYKHKERIFLNSIPSLKESSQGKKIIRKDGQGNNMEMVIILNIYLMLLMFKDWHIKKL